MALEKNPTTVSFEKAERMFLPIYPESPVVPEDELPEQERLVLVNLRELSTAMTEATKRVKQKMPEAGRSQRLTAWYTKLMEKNVNPKLISESFSFADDLHIGWRATHHNPQLETDIYMTDLPPEQIGYPETVYHVTSSASLLGLQDGGALLPPHLIDGRLLTHKGVNLSFQRELLEIFEIDVGLLNYFVFTGNQADPQEFAEFVPIHDSLKEHVKVETQQTFELIETVVKKLKTDEAIETIAQYFITNLYNIMFIRDGWQDELKNIILSMSKSDLKRIFDRLLTRISNKKLMLEITTSYSDKDTPLFPLVFEIDVAQAYQDTQVNGVNLFLASQRPVETIVPFPVLPRSAIKKVYVDEQYVEYILENKLAEGIEVLPISQMPQEKWLSHKTPEQVRLELASGPMCAVRYALAGEKRTVPWELVKNGSVAPAIGPTGDWLRLNFRTTPSYPSVLNSVLYEKPDLVGCQTFKELAETVTSLREKGYNAQINQYLDVPTVFAREVFAD